MANKVFYFSATGNSLAFARELAGGLGETQVISIMPRGHRSGVTIDEMLVR